MIACSPGSAFGRFICTNALGTSIVAMSHPFIASMTAVSMMLSKLAVGLEDSCLAVPSHCGLPSAQVLALMDMSLFCLRNAKLPTALICYEQVNLFMLTGLIAALSCS